VLALVLVAGANLAVVGAALATLHLGLVAAPVLTASMRPAYAPGDAVLTRPVPVQSIRSGMIVLVVPPGETRAFAHRVISVSGNPLHPTLRTKGDANSAADRWSITLTNPTAPQVIGVLPKLGVLPIALSTPRGHDFALALFGMVLTVGGVSQILALSRVCPPTPIAPARPAL
jgi:signal peptidase I